MMNPSTKAKLAEASKLPYLGWVREQLSETNSAVRRWIEWDPDLDVYEAFYDARQVTIPIPVCDWSFLVCLHEIGHISTGDRRYSYLAEYNAETWAMRRAQQRYAVWNDDYLLDSKAYVHHHLVQNVLYSSLEVGKVKHHVLDWLGISAEQVLEDARQYSITEQDNNLILR